MYLGVREPKYNNALRPKVTIICIGPWRVNNFLYSQRVENYY